MHVLDAFLHTWGEARSMFGDGAPDSGAIFDGSDVLRGAQSQVESAPEQAPQRWWSGAASTAYSAAGTRHARALADMAELEQRIAAEVDSSAELVGAGRRELDAVRRWVLDVADAAPRSGAGDKLLFAAVESGIRDVADVVDRSNGQLAQIGQRIRLLAAEYRSLAVREGAGSP